MACAAGLKTLKCWSILAVKASAADSICLYVHEAFVFSARSIARAIIIPDIIIG